MNIPTKLRLPPGARAFLESDEGGQRLRITEADGNTSEFLVDKVEYQEGGDGSVSVMATASRTPGGAYVGPFELEFAIDVWPSPTPTPERLLLSLCALEEKLGGGHA